MLFRDKLDSIRVHLEPEFEKLFQHALKNQSHPSDLLLVVINGGFEKSMEGFELSKGRKASPYIIGPGSAGLADGTHYEFIHQYRSKLSEWTYPEYLKLHEWDKERKGEIDELLKGEQMTVHLESMVYLKIWEGDHFIKTWYELVQILEGNAYDWHFKVKSSSRGEGIASRQQLLRIHIRDKIKKYSKPVFDSFQLAYKTQIRNSIAHSNFSFLGRNMHPNNFIDGDLSHQLHNLPFDEWVDMFHTTIMLHNFYIWLKNKINRHYGGMFLKDGKPVEIRITKDNGDVTYTDVIYRPEFDDWKFR